MIKKYYPTLLAVALSATVATNASAVLIMNLTTNTVLFSDGFENVPASPVGFADDDGSADFDPVADTGTWSTLQENDSDNRIQVSDFSGTSYPSAAVGDNYLRINRSGGFVQAVGTLSAPQTTAGDRIRVELSLYVRAGGPDVIAFYETTPGVNLASERFRLNTNASGNILSNGAGTSDTGLDWIANQWQTWQIDFVIGQDTFDLTVDGVTATGIDTEDGSNFDAFRQFRFGSTDGVEFLADSIPEPSSAMLLGLLGVFVAMKRRKKS